MNSNEQMNEAHTHPEHTGDETRDIKKHITITFEEGDSPVINFAGISPFEVIGTLGIMKNIMEESYIRAPMFKRNVLSLLNTNE